MKKSFIIPALSIAMTVAATSCSKDDDPNDFPSYTKVTMPTLYVGENTYGGIYDVEYRVDMSASQIILSAAPVFGANGSFSFKTAPAPFRQSSNALNATFPGNATTTPNTFQVSDVNLRYVSASVVPPNNPELESYYSRFLLLASYKVGADNMAYTVPLRAAFAGNFTSTFTTAQGQEGSFQSSSCVFEYILDVAAKKADVYIYEAQFAQQMPAQKVLWLQGLDMELSEDGIELSGANVVPRSREGSGWTPYENFTFNDIEFEIKTPTMTAAEIDFTVAGRFHGDFKGSSIK